MIGSRDIIVIVVAIAATGCAVYKHTRTERMPFVRVSADGRGFLLETPGTGLAPVGHGQDIQGTGKLFCPWGFNYDRDYNMRLLEEYWGTEWKTVSQDFKEMKALGANVVRVHLQFARFMNGPSEPNEEQLARLTKLLNLAERNGLYLDITGLGCYRKRDVPGWYDSLGESERWDAQAAFWAAIARTCKASPAVFCYDLMNEPLVPAEPRKPKDWLVANLLDFWYVQAITLDPEGRDRTEIASQWIKRLTAAIRKYDREHMITVGLLPNSLEDPLSASGFVPSKISKDLDFVSVHIYPGAKSLEEDVKTLAGFQVGKPLVVEEIFPLNGGLDVLDTFMRRGSKHACGWIGFYWGQTPEELAKSKELSAGLIHAWLDYFKSHAGGFLPVEH